MQRFKHGDTAFIIARKAKMDPSTRYKLYSKVLGVKVEELYKESDFEE